jgi:hypothetical protein
MGSFNRPGVFHRLDLNIIDRVYEAAWAHVEAHDPFRDRSKDGERQDALRKWLFALATPGSVDFDRLYDKVLASMPNTPKTFSELGNSPQISALEVDEGTRAQDWRVTFELSAPGTPRTHKIPGR